MIIESSFCTKSSEYGIKYMQFNEQVNMDLLTFYTQYCQLFVYIFFSTDENSSKRHQQQNQLTVWETHSCATEYIMILNELTE